jgi:hypothetical protein
VLLGFLSKDRCRGKNNEEQRSGDDSHSVTPTD